MALFQDMIFIMTFMFGFGIFTLTLFFAWNEINTELQAADAITPEAKALFDEQATAYNEYSDNTYVTVFFMTIIGVLVISFFLATNPILFWLFWMLTLLLGAIAGYLANAWITITSQAPFDVVVTNYPKMNFFITNYLEVMIVVSFLSMIVFFAKKSGVGGTGIGGSTL